MTSITIAYRDMLATRARTILDDLRDIVQPLQAIITAEIEAGARKGVTSQMVRWQVLESRDCAVVDVWPAFHEDDETSQRAYLILPWEDVDQSFDGWQLGTDNDMVVYAEIIAAVKRGKDHGYITTDDGERVVAWNRFDS